MFIAALETVPEADRPSLRDELLEVIEEYFDDGVNAVSMEYRLTKGTVH